MSIVNNSSDNTVKIYYKSTQRAHTSLARAAHYPHIAQIPNLESQHGDPDHPKNLIVPCIIAAVSWKLC